MTALYIYLVFVAAVFIALFAGFVYYQSGAAPTSRLTKHGLTPARSAVAAIAGLTVAAGLHLLAGQGALSALLSGRSYLFRVGIWLVALVAGCEGIAGGYGLARRWQQLQPDAGIPTGGVDGGTVTVAGRVVATETAPAPVTGREAVCWSWTVDVVDPGLRRPDTDSGTWGTVDGGTDGVRFGVDDGSGPVRIRPDDMTLDLDETRSLVLSDDDRLPSHFRNPAPDVESDYGGRPRKYAESALEAGDQVAVTGTVCNRRDGYPVLSGAHVAAGSLRTVAARYRRRALLYLVGGTVAILAGIGGLLWALSIPVG